MLKNEDVVWAYRLYLDREPESDNIVKYAIENFLDRKELVRSITNSAEYKSANDNIKPPPNPFWHYSASYDAIEIINKYAKKSINPSPSHATNFLGVKIRPEFFPNILTERIGTVESIPIPANWHADVAEWASCLRSIDLSGDRYVMMELGCGWGCWMNNLGVAAKSFGKQVKLHGIEADLGHIEFARLALSDNNICEDEYTLSRGIAGKNGSTVLFPKLESGIDWGGEAIFNPNDEQCSGLIKTDTQIG